MKTVMSQCHALRVATSPVLLLGLTLANLFVGQCQVVHAQRTTSAPFGTFLDEVGIMDGGTFIPGPEATAEQLAGNPLMFENHTEGHSPILMPDGSSQVTYNDINNVTGSLTVVDVGAQGTRIKFNVDGLIPGGLYTAWIDLYQAPGFTPDFAHELAVGALGYDFNNPPQNPSDYLGNVITADVSGRGVLETIQPPGPASWYTTDVVDGFEVPGYVLDAPVAEFHILLAYHADGNTWGPRPGAGEGFDAMDETWVSYSGALVAIPEPSTFVLAALGLVGVIAWRRRQSHAGLADFTDTAR